MAFRLIKVTLLLMLFAAPIVTGGQAFAAKKAFVVGIDAYTNIIPLSRSVFSAQKMTDRLASLGFKVSQHTAASDTSLKGLKKSWSGFLSTLNPGDEVVIYYSGHGLNFQGTNYWIPRDVHYDEVMKENANLAKLMIAFPDLINALKKKSPAATIWIIDACRNNPLPIGKQLNVMQTMPLNSLIMYAAGDGEEARDELPNEEGAVNLSSVYTRVLLSGITQNSTKALVSILPSVTSKVTELARPHPQHPYSMSSLTTNWCFAKCDASQLVDIVYETPKKITSANNAKELLAEKGFSKGVFSNAVFLGTKSYVGQCLEESPDKAPLGCAALRDIADGQTTRALNLPMIVRTALNVRRRSPVIVDAKRSKWSCVVRVAQKGDKIALSAIITLKYADETFYWGTINEREERCMKAGTDV